MGATRRVCWQRKMKPIALEASLNQFLADLDGAFRANNIL